MKLNLSINFDIERKSKDKIPKVTQERLEKVVDDVENYLFRWQQEKS